MSGSPGGLQAVPSAAVDPSIGATPCLRETSRGGGRRHPRIPFCKSGLQAGCGRASQCSHKTNRHSTAGLGRSARTRPRQAPRRARRKGAHRLLAAGGLGPGRRSTGSSMPLPRKSGHFRIARTGHFSFALTLLWRTSDSAGGRRPSLARSAVDSAERVGDADPAGMGPAGLHGIQCYCRYRSAVDSCLVSVCYT